MKKYVAIFLVLISTFLLCSCGDTKRYEELLVEIDNKKSNAEFEEAYNLCEEAMSLKLSEDQIENIETLMLGIHCEELLIEIENKIADGDLEEAYNLCEEALNSEFNDEQLESIKAQRAIILELVYPGTFVVKPEHIIEYQPTKIGAASYFDIDMLMSERFDEVFCRYEFSNMAQRDLAAEQYKEHLAEKYNFLNEKYSAEYNYTVYYYADDNANTIAIQISNDHNEKDFVIFLDKGLYDLDRIDMSNKRASLLDNAILIVE